jgi:hypothetical protein
MADRKPTDYRPEILAAMQGYEKYSPRVVGGEPHVFEDIVPARLDSPFWRAEMAALAAKSAQENEELGPNDPRITDPLDRARYPGS